MAVRRVAYLHSADVLLQGPVSLEARQKHVEHVECRMDTEDGSGEPRSACRSTRLVSFFRYLVPEALCPKT